MGSKQLSITDILSLKKKGKIKFFAFDIPLNLDLFFIQSIRGQKFISFLVQLFILKLKLYINACGKVCVQCKA